MSTRPVRRAAIYIKEAAGYPEGENSKELQLHHCEEFCQYHDLEIVARYDDDVGMRHDLDWMMAEATPGRPALQLHRRLQAQEFLVVSGRDRALPGQTQSKRSHPRLHNGKLALNDDTTDDQLLGPANRNLHCQPRSRLQRPHQPLTPS